jgi:Uma2 family endonuclease
MAQTYVSPMTIEQFLEWQFEQDERYELIDGYPVKLMTGATDFHDRVVTNIIGALHAQLRGTRCRVATADLAVRTRIRSMRRGDVVVTCAPLRGDLMEAQDPRLIVEVLSKSNTGVDWERKLEEYRRLTGLAYLLLADSRVQAASLFTRNGDSWDVTDADTLEVVFQLPEIGCTLAMRDIYEDLTLPPARSAERA